MQQQNALEMEWGNAIGSENVKNHIAHYNLIEKILFFLCIHIYVLVLNVVWNSALILPHYKMSCALRGGVVVWIEWKCMKNLYFWLCASNKKKGKLYGRNEHYNFIDRVVSGHIFVTWLMVWEEKNSC
jgi:hypothetical protein